MTTAEIILAIGAIDPSDAPAILAALAAKLAQARPAPIIDNGAPSLVDGTGLAAVLNLKKSWLMSQARQGKIPSVKTGKYIRFSVAEVHAALRGRVDTLTR